MAQDATTIQVQRSTAMRLQSLKVPGLTYDDVINFALDHVPPEAIGDLFRQWQEEALASLQRDPRVRSGKRSSDSD